MEISQASWNWNVQSLPDIKVMGTGETMYWVYMYQECAKVTCS